jgi:hypothetical protein
MKILHLIKKAFSPLPAMSSIFNSYTNQQKYNPSVNKRTYNNLYTSSSKPVSNSIKKDPKNTDNLYNKNLYQSPLQYYNNQSNSKVMISSVKEPRIEITDKNEKIQTSQFRISDPKKSDTYLRGALR